MNARLHPPSQQLYRRYLRPELGQQSLPRRGNLVMVKRRQLHGKLQLRIYAWPGTFPVQRWVQVRSQVSNPCWSPPTCFLDIPAPGPRVRSLGGASSTQPQGNVLMLSGATSDQTFISTNTVVVTSKIIIDAGEHSNVS